jgi:hypothetical protein
MATIAANLQGVTARIARAAAAAGREPSAIALVAVSKTFPAGCVAEARAAGQRAFGENYVQEALAKQAALADGSLEWHFIGPIQSNKTRAIAEHFAWVHSVDRLKIAERLAAARPAGLPPLNVLLQVNVDAEDTKSGAAPDELAALAQAVARLPGLALRGLMCIPRPAADAEAQRRPFARLRTLRDALAAGGLALDTLSMGMSADLEAAVAEGSTLVRVGTAIFGERSAH